MLAGFLTAMELEQASRPLHAGDSTFCDPGLQPVPYPPGTPQPDTDGCKPWQRRAQAPRLGDDGA